MWAFPLSHKHCCRINGYNILILNNTVTIGTIKITTDMNFGVNYYIILVGSV